MVASNNTAATALSVFQLGVREYGLAECVRSDKGKENIGIAEFMLQSHGLQTNCHITCRSVQNQRYVSFAKNYS
jgi:hypothetical protein